MGRFLTALILSLSLDRLTKWLAVNYFDMWDIPIFGNVTYNTGMAFGIFPRMGWLTIPLTFLVVAGSLYYYWSIRNQSKMLDCAFGLLVGGALSNLIDRIFLRKVIDFIDLKFWPVFNIADTSVVIAVTLLLWKTLIIMEKPADNAEKKHENQTGSE